MNKRGDDGMKNKLSRAALYVRVSTDNQLDNFSISEQIDRLQAYCKAKDLTITKNYTDGGYSGGNMQRPALQQMLKDIDLGLIDMVIVYKLDRLSRSQKDTLTLIEDHFLARNVDFISILENFDTSTPFGRAMIGILSVFAQLEKDQITERFTMGRIGRAKSGFFHGGAVCPTGYDYKNGELIVNQYEALQVQELYNRFLAGHAVYDCWRHMQKKYGGWSSESLVRYVLKNELYTGKVKFKGAAYNGNHTAIISPEQFRQVQDIFRSSRRTASGSVKRSPFRASTLLSHLVYCGRCGARFHGEHGNYSCYSRTKGDQKYIIDPNCKNKKWKIPELDALVTDYISRLDFSELNTATMPEAAPSPDSIKERIDAIDRQIEKLIELYQLGSIPLETISQKAELLSKERNSLEESLLAMEEAPRSVLEEMVTARDTFLSLIGTGALEEKRACLSLMIEKIIIDDDNVNIIIHNI